MLVNSTQIKNGGLVKGDDVKASKTKNNQISVKLPDGSHVQFKTFNGCDHMFVDVKKGQDLTLSLRLGDGKQLTFNVFQSAKCVDIDLEGGHANQTMLSFDNGGQERTEGKLNSLML